MFILKSVEMQKIILNQCFVGWLLFFGGIWCVCFSLGCVCVSACVRVCACACALMLY